MKTVLIHGQNHKGSTYHVARELAEKCLRIGWNRSSLLSALEEDRDIEVRADDGLPSSNIFAALREDGDARSAGRQRSPSPAARETDRPQARHFPRRQYRTPVLNRSRAQQSGSRSENDEQSHASSNAAGGIASPCDLRGVSGGRGGGR